MATTGTYSFDPALNECIEEAVERAGMDVTAVGAAHLKAIFRSIKFMLNSEWAGIGERRWMIQQFTEALAVSDISFSLPSGVIDIVGMVLRRNSRDTEMYRVSRDEYLTLVDKNIEGRPDRYWVDRQASGAICYFWQAASNATDTLVYDALRNMQDPGNMQNTFQLPAIAHDAFCSGLAARIAQKYNYERFADLIAEYRGTDPGKIGGKLKLLREEDRDRADLEVYPSFGPPTTRR